MASADYLCCSKCGCKIVYTPEDEHPSMVYCPDCLEAEFVKVDRFWKALERIRTDQTLDRFGCTMIAAEAQGIVR